MTLEGLTIESFEPLIGTIFRVELPDGAGVDFRLIRTARVMESEAARLPRHPFSIYFLGPGSLLLSQRIYRLLHETFPPMEIFLVPVGREEGGFLYEAVFA